MDYNDIYVYTPPTYKEKRKDKYLLLWSDIPTWIICDKDLIHFLSLISKHTLQDTIDLYCKNHPAISKENLKQIIPPLIDGGVLRKKNNPPCHQADTRIRNVIVHPTNRCNLRCIMCCNSHNRVPKDEEISTNTIKQFLDDVRPYCTDHPTLSIIGGEPLLEEKKVIEITEHAKTIGFNHVGISTNGTLVTSEFAKKAKELDMEVQVSLDGVNAEENDYLRGKGTFKKIIKAIKILKKENVCVVTNYTCHLGNYKSLEQYFELAKKLNVDYARFGPVKRIGLGTNKNIKTLPVDKLLLHAYDIFKRRQDLRYLFGKDYLSAFANSCRLKVKYQWCGTGQQTLLLNPDGSIYPCTGHALPKFNAGNILDKPFFEIWELSPVLEKIREVYQIDKINKKCSSCIVRYWCMGGCRAEAYHCTHKMNSPAVNCKDIKKAIIEIMWLTVETPELGRGGEIHFD